MAAQKTVTRADSLSNLVDQVNALADRDKGLTWDTVTWTPDSASYGLVLDNVQGNHANFGTGKLLVQDSGVTVGTPLLLADGAVGAPAWGYASDPDTGGYWVSANRHALSAGGAKVLEVVNDGATFGLGIGMSPSVPLDVQRSSTDWVARIDQDGAGAGAKVLQLLTSATGATDAILSCESGGGGTVRFAVNADGSVTGLAWTAFTPTVAQSGAVTVTTNIARYRILGKFVACQMVLTVSNAAGAVAANNVVVTIPAAIQARTAGVLCGEMQILDSGTAFYVGAAQFATATTITAQANAQTAPLGSASFTAALAVSDVIYFNGTWEIA